MLFWCSKAPKGKGESQGTKEGKETGEERERRERKERRKQTRDKTNQNLEKSDITKDQIGRKICWDGKGKVHQNSGEAETEQLERSSLTEDHGQPVSLPVPSSSSDSTENTNKRKRHSSVSPMDGSRSHGKVIFIRLPSKKQNEFDALKKVGSTSFEKDLSAQSKDNAVLKDRLENTHSTMKGTSNIEQFITLRTNSVQVCSTSGQIAVVAPGKTAVKSVNKAVPTSVQKLELQYKNLLEKWVPPRLENGCLYADDPDSDWLFDCKDKNNIHAKKRQRCGSDSISCSRSSTWWPHTEYLHEIDVYALPFSVPY
ncbi:UNVERIFIED_CONTAM: hypothetical protein Sangu_1939900 [Sesamum angustifolium]|uniref:Uncharacterized protein n=1 Tax=Sesamum angustifolium TaxID=2727405 RepID=A0AAW2LVZ8_9LAMI